MSANISVNKDRETFGNKKSGNGFLRRFCRATGGAAAIEFAILIIPFMMIITATIETFVAYNAEQVLANAVDTFSRKIRTGQITFGMGRTTDMKETEFRAAFCAEIAVMITCESTEPTTAKNLFIDLRSFASFADMPTAIPRASASQYADLKTDEFKFIPGGAGSLTMFRVVYRWKIMTDLMRPYLTNVRSDGAVPTDCLIVSTAAFKSENYP